MTQREFEMFAGLDVSMGHCQTKTLGLAKAVTGRYQAAS